MNVSRPMMSLPKTITGTDAAATDSEVRQIWEDWMTTFLERIDPDAPQVWQWERHIEL